MATTTTTVLFVGVQSQRGRLGDCPDFGLHAPQLWRFVSIISLEEKTTATFRAVVLINLARTEIDPLVFRKR